MPNIHPWWPKFMPGLVALFATTILCYSPVAVSDQEPRPAEVERYTGQLARELAKGMVDGLRDAQYASYQRPNSPEGVFTFAAASRDPAHPKDYIRNPKNPTELALACVERIVAGPRLAYEIHQVLDRRPLERPIKAGSEPTPHVIQKTATSAASIIPRISRDGHDLDTDIAMDQRWPLTSANNVLVLIEEVPGKAGFVQFEVAHIPIEYDHASALLQPIHGHQATIFTTLPGTYSMAELGCTPRAAAPTEPPPQGSTNTAQAKLGFHHAELWLAIDGANGEVTYKRPDGSGVRSGDVVRLEAVLSSGGTPFLFHIGSTGHFLELYPGQGQTPIQFPPATTTSLLTADVDTNTGIEQLLFVVVPYGGSIPTGVTTLRQLHGSRIDIGQAHAHLNGSPPPSQRVDAAVASLAGLSGLATSRNFSPRPVGSAPSEPQTAAPGPATGTTFAGQPIVLHSRIDHR